MTISLSIHFNRETKMQKIISKHAKIKNLVKRVIHGNDQYDEIKVKIAAANDETKRIKNWNMNTSDEVMYSKLEHYLKLVNCILKDLRNLPVVIDIPTIEENRVWVENLTNNIGLYHQTGKDLQSHFANIVYGYEKLINSEIHARNIY